MSTENTPGDDSQPENESTSSFNLDSVIGEILGTSEEQAETPAEETPEAKPVDAPEKEAAPTEQKELKSTILAEKSRRERESRAEIEALKGSREQELADAKAEVVAELMSNPSAFARKHNITQEAAEDLALNFYALGLGDDAPDDLKAQVGISELERFKAEQKAELEQMRAELQREKEIERDRAVLRQYSGLLEDVPAEFPYLAVEASTDSQDTLQAMAKVADVIFKRDGQYPSAIQVAKLIETEISELAARYAAVGSKKQPDVKQTQMTESVEKETSTTLSTENLGRSAKRAPVGEEELFEDALEYYNKVLK